MKATSIVNDFIRCLFPFQSRKGPIQNPAIAWFCMGPKIFSGSKLGQHENVIDCLDGSLKVLIGHTDDDV